MRRAAAGKKRDANESAIVAALRAVGATVEQLSGPDVPDLLVGYNGLNWLMEVKVGNRQVRPRQAMWHQSWRGGKVSVVREPDDALFAIGCRARRTGS